LSCSSAGDPCTDSFGELLPAAVKGYVYYDGNNDRHQAGNESGSA